MSWTRRLLRTLRPQPLDTALDNELRFHLDQRTDDLIARGMSPADARREAALLFGNRTALRESARDRNVLVWLETTLQDLRYALRGMRRRPGFAAAAVVAMTAVAAAAALLPPVRAARVDPMVALRCD